MPERPIAITSLVNRHFAQERHDRRVIRYGNPIPEPVTRNPRPVDTWSDGKLIAILRILRSENAMECVTLLEAQGHTARQEHFAELRAEGLAFKRERARFHELTDDGQHTAAKACVHTAKRFGLHHIERQSFSGDVVAKCTCGFRASFQRKYQSIDSQLERAISRHLSDPSAWIRERAAGDAAMAKALDMIGGRHG